MDGIWRDDADPDYGGEAQGLAARPGVSAAWGTRGAGRRGDRGHNLTATGSLGKEGWPTVPGQGVPTAVG
mgnify:CR=1 FL=1